MTKTTSSLAIDSLCDSAKEEAITITVFYCDFLSYQEQTITSAMGSILQLSGGRGNISNDPRLAFQEEMIGFGRRMQ